MRLICFVQYHHMYLWSLLKKYENALFVKEDEVDLWVLLACVRNLSHHTAQIVIHPRKRKFIQSAFKAYMFIGDDNIYSFFWYIKGPHYQKCSYCKRPLTHTHTSPPKPHFAEVHCKFFRPKKYTTHCNKFAVLLCFCCFWCVLYYNQCSEMYRV